jgi:regulatory protein
VALARRKVPESVGASVLDRLTEVGLVDDGEYARAWVESRHAGRGLGRRALAAELHDRGVAAEHVEGAVDQLDAATEEETARALVRRRLPSVGGLSPAARQRRLLGLLARKGYAPGLAFRVVREAVSAVDDDGAEEIPFEGDLGEEGGLGVDKE